MINPDLFTVKKKSEEEKKKNNLGALGEKNYDYKVMCTFDTFGCAHGGSNLLVVLVPVVRTASLSGPEPISHFPFSFPNGRQRVPLG
jgi:hypothetical protein